MTMSGPTAVIARNNAKASYTSTTMGVTPAASSSAAFLLERVVPNTSQPALSNCGTSRLPLAPVAPARRTLAVMCVPPVRQSDPLQALESAGHRSVPRRRHSRQGVVLVRRGDVADGLEL